MVPVYQSKKLASLIPNATLKLIEGADHHYSNPKDFEKVVNDITNFLSRHML
jgi:alpha-beta hydrolase superfamily lysophospholipase